MSKKFDVVIGNPPYQGESKGDNKNYSAPIYPDFMDSAYSIANTVALITPGRFLFDAGSTPKKWNKKMLSDEYLKVLYYSEDSKSVFNGVDIAGGIAITLRDATKKNGKIGKIGLFLPHDEQKGILSKVSHSLKNGSLKDIAVASEAYKFTEKMHEDYPSADDYLSNGHKYDLKSNIFTKLDFIFTDLRMDDTDICIHGLINRNRTKKYIKSTYIRAPHNLEGFKLLFPKAGGSGGYGDKLSNAIVAKPGEGHTQTFLSFGKFDTELEPHNCGKYIKTKFLRSLLGTLKVTQDNPPRVWSNIPLQDFTEDSDIDWSKSIAEIDQQLYEKYNLTKEEINFIETNVKEMD